MTEAAQSSPAGVNQAWLPKSVATLALLCGVVTAAYGWGVLHVLVPNLAGDTSGFSWLGACTGVGGGLLTLASAAVLLRLMTRRGSVRRPLLVGAAAAAVAALPSIGDLLRFAQLWGADGQWGDLQSAGWWPAAPALIPLGAAFGLGVVLVWFRRAEAEQALNAAASPHAGRWGSAASLAAAAVAVIWSGWVLMPLTWDAREELPAFFRDDWYEMTPGGAQEKQLHLDVALRRVAYERSQPGIWYRDWFGEIEDWVVLSGALDARVADPVHAYRRSAPTKYGNGTLFAPYRLAYPGTLDAAAALAGYGKEPGDPALDDTILALAAAPDLMLRARMTLHEVLGERPDLADRSVPLLLQSAIDPAITHAAILDYGTPQQGVLPTDRARLRRRLRRTAIGALGNLGAVAEPALAALRAVAPDDPLHEEAVLAAELIEMDLAYAPAEPPGGGG